MLSVDFMLHTERSLLLFAVLWCLANQNANAQVLEFDRDVRPILSEHCFACHGPDASKLKAGLRMDRKESVFSQLESGATAVVIGLPNDSEMIRRIGSHDPEQVMPPPEEGKALTTIKIETLRRWVQEGAPWTNHWSFEMVKAPVVPRENLAAGTVSNPIDAFVLSKLQSQGLSQSPKETKEKLLRRVSLDLTGIPPSLHDVKEFLNDDSHTAFETVVDRLLNSIHFGERMAMPWLDLARYGDTSGYHNDSLRDMWLWREWVINAFNSNKPFDQFTIEQLAGDLVPEASIQQKVASGFHRNVMTSDEGGLIDAEYRNLYVVDRIATTGVTWLGMTVACAQCHDHKYDPITQADFYKLYAFFNNVPENGKDGVRDRNPMPYLRIISESEEEQLALHERNLIDANRKLSELTKELPEKQQVWEREFVSGKSQTELPSASSNLPLDEKGGSVEYKEIVGLAAIPAADRSQKQKEQLEKYFRQTQVPDFAVLQKSVDDLKKIKEDYERTLPNTMVMSEMEKPRDTFIKVRGNYDQDGTKVESAVPAFLPQIAKPVDDKPLNRLSLAKWLVAPEHPLTARVTVNRWWAMLFGTGIVKTLNDFGAQGERPSHPELLDWLATDLMRDWNTKRVLKQIVLSATYQQSSQVSATLLARDQENRLLARGPRQRLDAEILRDNALAIGGILNPTIGGKSIKPSQPEGTWEINEMSGYKYEKSQGADLYRRGLYVYWRRSTVYPSFVTLDAPTREFCVSQRAKTSTPLQSLVLMNDPVFVEAARAFAQRILAEPNLDDTARVVFAWRLALTRSPNAAERSILTRMLEQQQTTYRNDMEAAMRLVAIGDLPKPANLDDRELAAWTAFSNVILNLNETISN